MKQTRNRLGALLLAMLFLLLTAGTALAVADEPLPTEPTTEETVEPTSEEPTTEETTTEEPTTQEPTSVHTHAFGAWETVRRATNKKDGLRQRVCACGETQRKTFAKVASVTLKYSERTYNGKAQKNPVTVKDSAGKTLKNGKDYAVSYQNNKNVGKAAVTVKGKGNYRFTLSRSFRIVPQATAVAKVLPAATKATIQWKSVKQQCSGYQLQLAADKGFKQIICKRKISNAKTDAVVLTGLKEKATYYVRIRTFTLVKKTAYYAAWSKAKAFTTVSTSLHGIDGQLPKSKRVSPSWFDNAVFVGDSVSLGLSYYEAVADVLGKAQFLTAGSLGSGNALQPVSEKSVHPRYNGQKMKIEKAVAACGAKKVYIMLGMNDIGAYGVDKSVENFRTLCKKILAEAPFVKLYIQSVTPRVNQGAASDNVKLNNKNITAYNQKLAALCAEENWYFVNVAETMFDNTGHLKRAYCSDPDGMGMHFSYEGCKAWVDYLYTHTA